MTTSSCGGEEALPILRVLQIRSVGSQSRRRDHRHEEAALDGLCGHVGG